MLTSIVPEFARFTETFPAELINVLDSLKSKRWQEYRGQDCPSFPYKFGSASAIHDLCDKRGCYLTVGTEGDGKNCVLDVHGDPYKVTVGSGAASSKVQVQYELNSQTPLIKLEFNLGIKQTKNAKGEQVEEKRTAHILLPLNGMQNKMKTFNYPNGTTEDEVTASVSMVVGPKQKDCGLPPPSQPRVQGNPELQNIVTLHDQGRLWETRLDLIPVEDDGLYNQKFRPSLLGYDLDELHKIFRWSAYCHGKLDEVPEEAHYVAQEEVMAWLMFASTRISILEEWKKEQYHESFEDFKVYFEELAHLVHTYGDCWWYYLQNYPTSLNDITNVALGNLKPPYWLASQWEVNCDGEKVNTTPIQWGRFNGFDVPNPNAGAFLLKLGLIREHEEQKRRLDLLNDKKKDSLLAKINKVPNSSGRYLVGLTLPDDLKAELNANVDLQEDANSQDLKPEVGTRCRVEIIEEVKDGKSGVKTAGAWILEGTVIEDSFNLGSYLVTLLTAPHRQDVPEFAWSNSNRTFKAKMEFPHDPTSTFRELAALDIIQKGFKKAPEGVHIPNLVFRSNTPLNWRSLAPPSQEERDAYMEVMNRHKLEDDCLNAAWECMTIPRGVQFIVGPPGVGKSQLLVAVADGKINVLKEKIAVCTPTNHAGIALAKKIKGLNLATLQPHEWTIFNFSVPGTKAAELLDESGGEGMDLDPLESIGPMFDEEAIATDDEVWLMLEDADAINLKEQLFPVQFQTQMAEWSQLATNGEEHYVAAKLLVDLQQEKRKWPTKSSGGDTEMTEGARTYEDVIKELRRAERKCQKHFFAKKNLVISTCNSAAHPILTSSFHPTSVLIDEAGVASAATAATPLASYGTSLKQVILVGDSQQHRPRTLNHTANESAGFLTRSLFENSLGHPHNLSGNFHKSRFPWSYLSLEYRMHPHIGEWLQYTYYPKLRFHRDANDRSALQLTCQAFLQYKLGQAWNGRFRIGVDVSGRSEVGAVIKSKLVPGSTTSQNYEEARALVALIEALCNYTDLPDGGQQVTPEDFIVASPYEGQCRCIEKQLAAKKIRGVNVLNTNKIQGHENKIALVSMCKHDPNKPEEVGFIWRPAQLCVELSRGSDLLVVFGNFKDWALSWEKAVWKHTQKRIFDSFIADMYLGGREQDGREDFVGNGITWEQWYGGMSGTLDDKSVKAASLRKSVPFPQRFRTGGEEVVNKRQATRPLEIADREAKKIKAQTTFGGRGRGGRGGRNK